MQLTPEAKQAITAHWTSIVEHLSLLYASGSIKSVTESINLNGSIHFIDGFLKDVLIRDCDCADKEKKG